MEPTRLAPASAPPGAPARGTRARARRPRGRRARSLVLVATLAWVATTACGGPEALGTARRVVGRWFDALAARDVEAARALYVAPRAEGEADDGLRAELEALARRGAPDARAELSWKVHARASDDGHGWFVTLVEEARWGECRLTFRFLVHRPFGADGDDGEVSQARIVRHERVAEGGCDRDGLAV